jgi:hypothetical protein
MLRVRTTSITGKTVADGRQVVALGEGAAFREHDIQVVVDALPAAGALYVEVKTPGASDFAPAMGFFDLTDADDRHRQYTGAAEAFRFNPAGLTAGRTYAVYVTSTAA